MSAARTAARLAAVSLCLSLACGIASAQDKSLKEQIVGTWTFVSSADVTPDGVKTDRWGPGATGIFFFDQHGHYAQFISRADLPKFAGKRIDAGTEEEMKAVMKGVVASFGTYTVNEAERIVTTTVKGSVYPNLVGVAQKRLVTSLTSGELRYTNPTTSTGTTAQVIWKRAN
jgi:Lipocalin-like domain